MAPDSDRAIERSRYDAAARVQAQRLLDGRPLEGIESSPARFRPPYLRYHQLIRQYAGPGARALEIGAGNGAHTKILAATGAQVIALDVSTESLRICQLRADAVAPVCGDMAALPFADDSFDILVSAGSLSYADPDTVNEEIWRVLRPGGSLLIVDSLNHNPMYRLNRWVHYRRGMRTRSTVERMPTLDRINRLKAPFQSSSVEFFGTWLFLHPPLAAFVGEERATQAIASLERRGPKRYSFKFVLCARGFIPDKRVSS